MRQIEQYLSNLRRVLRDRSAMGKSRKLLCNKTLMVKGVGFETLTIRFSHEDIQRLREEAVEQGVGPSTLARMLVKKGLRTL